MAGSDLLMNLMQLQGGAPGGPVASPAPPPAPQPILQGENPLTPLQGAPPATIPAVTPAPNLAANPTERQVTSLEQLLFGGF